MPKDKTRKTNERLEAERGRLELKALEAGLYTAYELREVHQKARERVVLNERMLLLRAVEKAGIATLQELDALVASKRVSN